MAGPATRRARRVLLGCVTSDGTAGTWSPMRPWRAGRAGGVIRAPSAARLGLSRADERAGAPSALSDPTLRTQRTTPKGSAHHAQGLSAPRPGAERAAAHLGRVGQGRS